jgi:hypothetical protein
MTKVHSAVFLAVGMVLFSLLGMQAGWSSMSDQDALDTFNRLKAIEDYNTQNNLWPPSSALHEVGAFDPNQVGQNRFAWTAPLPKGTVYNDAVTSTLAFRIIPNTAHLRVYLTEIKVLGQRYVPPSHTIGGDVSGDGMGAVALNVGYADSLKFILTATDRAGREVTYSDTLLIKRHNPLWMCGAFYVPVLPVAIIYAPPRTDEGNTATYTFESSQGTTLTSECSEESSTTRPTETGYGGLNTYRSIIGTVTSAAKNVPVVGPMLQAFNGFLNGLGNVTATEEQGTISVEGHSLALEDREGGWVTTLASLSAPGEGDIIVFKRHALFAWVFNGSTYTQTLLNDKPVYEYWAVSLLASDYQAMTGQSIAMWTVPNPNAPTQGDPEFPSPPAATPPSAPTPGSSSGPKPAARLSPQLGRFKAGQIARFGTPTAATGSLTGLSADAILSLVRQDPFTWGPNIGPLDYSVPGRFVEANYSPITVGGGNVGRIASHTVTYGDWTGSSNFTTCVEKHSKGWLSFLGIGESENKTIRSSSKCTYMTNSRRSQSFSTTVSLTSATGLVVHVYYDRAFGTWAFQSGGAPGHDSIFDGLAQNEDGSPARNKYVTLTVGGKSFLTRTDAQGHYVVRSPGLADGSGTLTIGTKSRPVSVKVRAGALQKTIPMRPLRLPGP